MKVFIIDISRCNGCYGCQIVCKDEHCGNDWTPYAKPQPDTGQFWLKMNETVRGTVPKVKVAYQPVLCMHCDDAPCLAVCPVEGGIYKRHDGLVIINPGKCTGCKKCVDACPYDAVYYNEYLNLAQKCTGCAHLLDKGWKEPRCVDVCPTQALMFGEESELKDLLNKAEAMKPELSTKPRVYYLNMPGMFIAGTVYDPVEEEVIIGANCILTDMVTGEKYTAITDSFGDFWFHGLGVSIFSLEIKGNGKTKTIDSVSTENDVNLGDIPLS
ncbi:4Fe-4S dicluster domain-containing protein [Chloroflexota bacterium]